VRAPVPAWCAPAWQAASLLLGYPDERLREQEPLLRRVVDTVPDEVADPLGRFLGHFASTPLRELQESYVDTFDSRRRCCLYLTYYACGDTRKRGVALLRLKQSYRRAGLELGAGELSDHLGVVLEFAATGDAERGRRILLEHRAGLELLRLGLTDAGSPYADVVRAVCATLPPLAGDDRGAVARLLAEGPPAEEVGLQPFAPPEYMPAPGVRR
jgi:nitrate reductase molybdenum cofactor assembly chaperone NarJ/NarW